MLRRSFSLKTAITQPTSYISRSTCPYFNLALEDWIFRNTPAEIPLLLLYRNRPSVIIGRNQNPWKEINQNALKKLDIAFVRRRSGGGTVYHDLGNTNYSIMIPRTSFERRPNAELVARAVASLGPPAEVNERNDIVVEGFKICSAYKIVNKRAYHHGTMLIDAKLDQLGELLHNTKENLVTKGVASVRSAVRNLRTWAPEMTHDDFSGAVVKGFEAGYGGSKEVHEVDESLLKDEPGIETIYRDLQTWDWQYGQTPEFTNRLTASFPWGGITAHISSKHGIITSLAFDYTQPLVGDAFHDDSDDICLSLAGDLVGKKYGLLEEAPTTEPMRNDIITWLQREM